MSVGGGSQQSTTENSSWNNAWANAISSMRSSSDASNNAFNRSSSFVDPVQQGYLQQLYGQAMGAANPAGVTEAARVGSNAILPGMQDAYASIGGLMDTRGQIDAQTASLKSGLGDMFRKELMPAIERGAIGSGGFGGGRQGVAEGVAAGELANAFTAGLGDITARANQTALGAGQLMPSLAQGLYTAHTAPQMAGLDPLARLSSILGSPTVLSSSLGRSSGTSTSRGRSDSRSRSRQNAGSSATSESEGWNFNFGLFG